MSIMELNYLVGVPVLRGGGDGSVLLSTHWDILKCPEYRGGLVSGMG